MEQKMKANVDQLVEVVNQSPELLAQRRRNVVQFLRQRLLAGPGGSILFHLIMLAIIMNMAVGRTISKAPTIEVTLVPETVQPPPKKPEQALQEIKKIEVPERPPDVETPPDIAEQGLGDPNLTGPTILGDPLTGDPNSQGSGGGEGTDAGIGSGLGTDQGFEISVVRSPLVIKGLYASRTAGGRLSALKQYGGGGGTGSGSLTELAVLRALRWLKKYQETDGSWNTASGGGPAAGGPAAPAMTGLALLTFLAHAETPSSEEFGGTVERGIKWLVAAQKQDGRFEGSDGNEYSLPIASYALCEAYSMTRIPMIKDAAMKSTEILIKGQNATGNLWNYRSVGGSDRNDLSYSGWCIQALKAAKMAELTNPGLNDSIKRAIEGLKQNYKPSGDYGGYSYTTGGGPGQLTTVGVLCMQLLGCGADKTTQSALRYLDQMTCDWQNPWGANPIYYWYYGTQAKFQAGGATWKTWNGLFATAYVKNQTVVPQAIEDVKGNKVDIGYWISPGNGEHCKSYVYNTSLCALCLTVYYRYLPSYKVPEEIAQEAVPSDEMKIDIK